MMSYPRPVTERPSKRWSDEAAREDEAIAAGTLDPDQAPTRIYWPVEFRAAVDGVLDAYEAEVSRMDPSNDESVLAAVGHVVEQLNDVDDEYRLIESGERDELAAYIDAVLTDAGVDIEALADRNNISPDLTEFGGRSW
jgi:hypothetical protein